MSQYLKNLVFQRHFCWKIRSARAADGHIFADLRAYFSFDHAQNLFSNSGIIPVILVPINPLQLEKYIGHFLCPLFKPHCGTFGVESRSLTFSLRLGMVFTSMTLEYLKINIFQNSVMKPSPYWPLGVIFDFSQNIRVVNPLKELVILTLNSLIDIFTQIK